MKIAVIGAGVAGLCSIHNLVKSIPDAEVTAYELSDTFGGTWVYKEKVGEDEFGMSPSNSMYKNLRTNLPKEAMSFSDYPIPKSYNTFMDDEEFLGYIKDFAQFFDLLKYVKFRHLVKSVKYVDNEWEVVYRDILGEEDHTKVFDYVVVCNGHYNKPFTPRYIGQDIFKGKQSHSHNYRLPSAHKDKKVLIIGGGPSGVDIAMDVLNCCSKLVMSHHNDHPVEGSFPSHFMQKPDVKEFTEDSVIFVDGTSEEIDEILYCTGYAYFIPFLDSSTGVVVNNTHITPLYHHIVNIEHSTMLFVGIPQLCCTIPMIDIQSRYCAALIKGNFSLPSKVDMTAHNQALFDKKKALGFCNKKILGFTHILAKDEAAYYTEISEESGVVNIPKAVCDMRTSTMQSKKVNVYTYRNYNFRLIDNDTFEKTYGGDVNGLKKIVNCSIGV